MDSFIVFVTFFSLAFFIKGIFLKLKAAQLAKEKKDAVAEASYLGDVFYMFFGFLVLISIFLRLYL